MPVETINSDLRRTQSNPNLPASEVASPVPQDEPPKKTKRKNNKSKKKPKRKSNDVSISSSNALVDTSTTTATSVGHHEPVIVNGAQITTSHENRLRSESINAPHPAATYHPSHAAISETRHGSQASDTPIHFSLTDNWSPGLATDNTANPRYADGSFSSDSSYSVPNRHSMMPEPSQGPFWYHHEEIHPNGDNLGIPGPSFLHQNPLPPHRSYSASYFHQTPPGNGYPAPSYVPNPSYRSMHGYMPFPPRYHTPNDHSMVIPAPYPGHSYHSTFPGYYPPPSYPGRPMPYPENGSHENHIGEAPAWTPHVDYSQTLTPPTPRENPQSSPSVRQGADQNHSVDPVSRLNHREDDSDDESELSDTTSSVTEPVCEIPSVDDAGRNEDGHPENATAELDPAVAPESEPVPDAKADELDSSFPIRLALCSFLDVLPLTEHLLRSFEGEQFTDAQLVLTSMENMFYPITFRVHQVIVAQSPVLASILKKKAALEEKNVINIVSGTKFCLARAFETALQNFYGLPMVDGPRLKQLTMKALGWEGCPVEIDSMKNKGATIDFAICYGVSGAFLHSREILETGFKLVIELIEWDTLQLALQFGLFPVEFLVTYDVNAPSERSTVSNGPNRRGGKKKAHNNGVPELNAPPIHDTLNGEVVDIWSPKIATAALQFMIRSLPRVFHFDRLALVSSMPDRVPQELRTVPGSILANPKLASVKFGSLGSASEQKPSRECSIASAVFLSLPFERLREAFDIMRQRRVLSLELVKAILQEREERRLRALQAYAKRNPKMKEQDYPEGLKELGYEEYVIPIERQAREGDKLRDVVIFSDFVLEREWKGYSWAASSVGNRLIRKKA